jgi:hypothetical protein
LPLTRDVGNNISELKKAHPDWKQDQLTAASLNGAREAGNTDIKEPSSVNKRQGQGGGRNSLKGNTLKPGPRPKKRR